MKIKVDDLAGPEVKRLLADHLQGMADHSPPDCIHALDLDELRAPDITFWSVWNDDELLGCGALKELDYERLSLETGSGAAFEPAHSLYLKLGFEFCGPFADYSPGEFNRSMTLPLESRDE